MEEIWTRIEAWMSHHAPQILGTLQPGATEAEITQLEAFLFIQLPEDFKALYRLCNGQSGPRNGVGLFKGGLVLLSLDRIIERWGLFNYILDSGGFDDNVCDPEAGVHNVWWCPQWIPLACDGTGKQYCLDLDPAKGGVAGQIITMSYESGEREVVALSIIEWLEQYAWALECGELIFSEYYNGIVDVADDDRFFLYMQDILLRDFNLL